LSRLGNELTARPTRRNDPRGADPVFEGEADNRDRLDIEIAGGISQGQRRRLGTDRETRGGVFEIGGGVNFSRIGAEGRPYREQRIGRVGSG